MNANVNSNISGKVLDTFNNTFTEINQELSQFKNKEIKNISFVNDEEATITAVIIEFSDGKTFKINADLLMPLGGKVRKHVPGFLGLSFEL